MCRCAFKQSFIHSFIHRHGKTLSDINDIFDMSCLLSKPTCFKGDQGTLFDVFLTNRLKKFYKSTSVETGITAILPYGSTLGLEVGHEGSCHRSF